MSKTQIETWLFGKPYLWVIRDNAWTLIPDRHFRLLFPNSSLHASERSRAQTEHKFTQDLTAGKSALAAQASLYAQLLSPTCVRCGQPAPFYESWEIDPLCTACVLRFSYMSMWRELGQ